MSEQIAKHWLDAVSTTAARHDFDAHMDLVSRRVNVLGVPGFDSIGYDNWATQCRHEFSQRLIKAVRYQGLKMCASTDTRIMFKTLENIETSDGSIHSQGIEVLLEKEDDGKWRVVQERILPPDEVAHAGLDG